MTAPVSLDELRTAYLLARANHAHACDPSDDRFSPIDAERQQASMEQYAHEIAELVAGIDLGSLVPA